MPRIDERQTEIGIVIVRHLEAELRHRHLCFCELSRNRRHGAWYCRASLASMKEQKSRGSSPVTRPRHRLAAPINHHQSSCE